MAELPRLLRSKIAGPATEFLLSSRGFNLSPRDSVILNEAGGRDPVVFYRDLEKDDRVRTVLTKRYTNVMNSEIIVNPGKRVGMSINRRDRKAAERIKEHINALGTTTDNTLQAGFAAAQFATGFDQFSMGMLDAILIGFATAEAVWGVSGLDNLITDIHIRDQRKFRFSQEDDFYGLNLLSNRGLLATELMPARKFFIYIWGSTDDPYGLGLGHSLYWPVFFKRHDMSHWLKYLEKFGLPTVVGKHVPGADDKTRMALLNAGKALQSDSVIVIPDNQMLELLELAHTSVTSSGFDKLLKEMNKAITINVLGSSLSTDIEEGGSRAAAEVHSEEEKLLAIRDEQGLSQGPYRTYSRWTTILNDEQAATPEIRRRFPANENLVEEVGVVKTIFDMGYDPSEKFINDKFGAGQEEPVFTKRENFNPQPALATPQNDDQSDEG